jgi:DNA-binding NarL/FixJ family response regulator
MKRIAVMIADDHPIIRSAIRKYITKKPFIDLVGEANNGLELLELIKESCPDIAIIDLEMPEMNGYDTISVLSKKFPEIKSIAFSGFLDSVNQQRAISLGVFSTVSKNDPPQVLIEAVESAIDGKRFHTQVVNSFNPDSPTDDKYSLLTLREKEVLRLIAQGKTSKQISSDYNISKWTVDKHRSNIKGKLGIKNLAGIVRYAIEKK